MKKFKIRKVTGKAFEDAFDLAFYGFSPTPGAFEEQKKKIRYYKEDYGLVLYENGHPASGLMCKPLHQNVRGTIKPMCGVANVATNPEARRKGYARELMKKAFFNMKGEGQVFSTLYPFKESFYEKYGYISFPQIRTAIVTPKSLTSLLSKDLKGEVERMSLKEGFEIYRDFLLEMQSATHGFSIVTSSELQRLKDEEPYWLAIAKDRNKVVGVSMYKITGFWKEIKIRDFYYSNSKGKYLLLKWFGMHVDQVKEVHIPIMPNEFPETWLNDAFWGEYGHIKSRDWVPSAMGRVVIIDKLSGLHVGTGKISAKITDDFCKWNNDTFTFESKEGSLYVSKGLKHDCQLTIHGLSAIIYGCYKLDDFPIKGWGEVTEKTNRKIQKLFPPKLPFLHADF